MLKKYDKNGTEVNLLQNTDYRKFNVYANSGYTIIHNHSFEIDDKVFLIIGIRKNSGVFDSSDQVSAYVDDNVKFIAMTCFCGLGSSTDWLVDTMGYCFVGGKNIIISDRNFLGKQDRAYINMICLKE